LLSNVIVSKKKGAHPQTKMNNIVTINDVAEAAGVGKGTVDRVLHNRGRVSEETRKRVLKCIEELGYKPNTAARMLAKRRIYKIAVIYHNKEIEFWRQVEEGVIEAAEEYKQMGIVVDQFILPQIDIDGQLALIDQVIERKYDGLAIVPYCSPKISEALSRAAAKKIQVITFNNDEECGRACYVGQDLLQSGRTAGKLMGMIAEPDSRYAVFLPIVEGMSALYNRYIGFREVLDANRKDMKLIGVFSCAQEGEQAYEKAKALIQREKVDAIYASNGIVANIAQAVEDLGYSQKIKLVGHDLTDFVVKYIESGTINVSIGQEAKKQGYIAVEKLCRNLLMDEEITGDVYTKIVVTVKENLAYV